MFLSAKSNRVLSASIVPAAQRRKQQFYSAVATERWNFRRLGIDYRGFTRGAMHNSGRRRPHGGGGDNGGRRRQFDGGGRGRGGGGRGGSRGLIQTQDLETVGGATAARQPSAVVPHQPLDARLSALTLTDGPWIEPRANTSAGVPYREASVATNVWRLVPTGDVPELHHYSVERVKREFVPDGAAPDGAAPDAAPAPGPAAPGTVVATPGARAEELFADGTRKPAETKKRRTIEALRAVGEAAGVAVLSDGAQQLYASGPLEGLMSASGVVFAPVADKPWRQWAV